MTKDSLRQNEERVHDSMRTIVDMNVVCDDELTQSRHPPTSLSIFHTDLPPSSPGRYEGGE